ncbi:MAG: M56 family metallopeptidase, partial [Candidatus Hydrogenedentales bacterium]
MSAFLLSGLTGLLFAFPLNLALRSGVFLAVAFIAAPTLRRSSGARSHQFWLLCLLAVLALPVFVYLFPTLDLPLLSAHARTVPLETGLGSMSPAGETQSLSVSSAPYSERAEMPDSAPGTVAWSLWMAGAWAIGSCFCILRLMLGMAATYAKTRRAQAMNDAEWVALLEEARERIGVRRQVRLLVGASEEIPMTWGVLKSTILLPPSAMSWPLPQKRAVLEHELAHVKRADVTAQLVAQLACALYWFNPLTWRATARLSISAERACDDLVLAAGARPSEYADHLLAMLRTMRFAPASPLISAAMAHHSSLEQRVRSLLDPRQDRQAPSRRVRALLLGAIATLGILSGTLQPIARAEEATQQLIVAPNVAALNPETKAQWQAEGIT